MTPQRILFVCLGNICRSPAAEGVLRTIAEQEGIEHLFEIDSAGTYGGHAGESSDYRMREAAFTRGYSLTHRSRQITEEDLLHFDRIIVMDDNNLRDVERIAPTPESRAKIERFANLVTQIPDIHYVPDPYYEGREGFHRVLDILEDGCRNLLAFAHREQEVGSDR
ncbi:MAG: low molecular weight protein-tyrosine-phosphatase [Rikenellaceae bacterium]